MEAIGIVKSQVNYGKDLEPGIVFSKDVVVDYDMVINDKFIREYAMFHRNIKEISDDICQVKTKRQGKKKVKILLFDFGKEVGEKTAAENLRELDVESAGVHEIFQIAKHLEELPIVGEFSISSLRDQWLDNAVEFIPTIYSIRKNSARIMMCMAVDLPFKHSYFLGVKYI